RRLGGRGGVEAAGLQAAGAVGLVADERAAERGAVLVLVRGGLLAPLLLREVLERGHRSVLEEVGQAAPELVRPLLRHGVDDGARRAAVLGVELAGEQLELLHRLNRDARLRAA